MINFGGLLSGSNKARRINKTSHELEAVSTEISLSFNNNNSTTYQNVPVQFFAERLLTKKINYGGQELPEEELELKLGLPEEELELKLGLPDGGVYTPSSKEQTPTNLSLLTGVGHMDPEEGNSFSRIHVEAQHQQLQPKPCFLPVPGPHQQLQPQRRQPLMLFETQPPKLPLKVERKNEDMLRTIMNRRRSLERMMLPRSQSVPPHYRTRVWPRLGPALPQPQPPQPSEVAAWKASMAKSAPRRRALNQFRSTPGPAGAPRNFVTRPWPSVLEPRREQVHENWNATPRNVVSSPWPPSVMEPRREQVHENLNTSPRNVVTRPWPSVLDPRREQVQESLDAVSRNMVIKPWPSVIKPSREQMNENLDAAARNMVIRPWPVVLEPRRELVNENLDSAVHNLNRERPLVLDPRREQVQENIVNNFFGPINGGCIKMS